MGIQGLLTFLKNADENVSAIKPSHLSKLRGKKAAIDAYSWLHKGVFSCAHDLFLNKPTTKYVDYCVRNLKLLLDHHITPVLVFDGGRMPFKVVEAKRREDRQKAKKEANDLIAMGKMNEAFNQMVQSINVTHEMASNLMKAARNIGVESVVAPYEADAQLVYLEQEGIVDFIISEDSDLIIFGAKKIFFKMASSGHGEVFDIENVECCLKANKRLTKSNFASQKLLYAAILSGCDYLKNIPGIGLIKAWKFMHMTENDDIRQFLKKVPSYLKLAVTIDDEYVESFVLAVLAFKYQIVFDTRRKMRVPLNPIDDDESKDDYNKFLNCFTSTECDHLQLALGNIDHKNRQYDQYHPSKQSYLYHGATLTDPSVLQTVESPGFSTDARYKRSSRNSSGKRSLNASGFDREKTYQEDDDLTAYYKNMDTSTKEVAHVEKQLEPPRKRIKCKFFKYKSLEQDGVGSQVHIQSRFFQTTSDPSIKTDEETICVPTKGNEDCTDALLLKENQTKMDENTISMRKTFQNAGIEVESENSNDGAECGDKDIVDVDLFIPSKSPVIGKKSPVIGKKSPIISKPKLKEIQNVSKFSRVKKKILGKNQPTMLSFFTKL